MDLTTVTEIRQPGDRSELGVSPTEAFLGGGSWLFSEPQIGVTGLVDLTALRWPALEVHADGLRVAATCTFAELAAMSTRDGWASHPLFRQCCTALLGSFKVWNTATVGGNICLALPAGPMTSLATALEAVAVIWTPGGSERRSSIVDLVTGVQTTTLVPGEVLRCLEFPERTLPSRTAYRKLALSPLGRSGTLVIGRLGGGEFTVTVTAATTRPHLLRFAEVPTQGELRAAVDGIEDWYDDAHGAPDWREAMSALLAEQIRRELSA